MVGGLYGGLREGLRSQAKNGFGALLAESPLVVALVGNGAWSDSSGTTPAVNGGPVGKIWASGSLFIDGLIQSGASNRPTYRSGAFNGRDAIQLTADDWLTGTCVDRHSGSVVIYQAFSVPNLYVNDFTCQLVLRDSSVLPADPRRYEQTGWATGGNAGDFANWVPGTAHTTSRPTTPMIFEIRLTVGDVIRFRKSGLADDASGGAMTSLAFDSLAVGANWSTGTPFAPIDDMFFAGIGIYDAAVLNTQQKRDAMYQAWRAAFGL